MVVMPFKRKTLLLFPFIALSLYAEGLQDIEKFFSAKGTIVGKADKELFICTQGLPYFKVGFPVALYRGSYIENPLTHKKTFVIISETGKGQVVKSFKTNSLIRATEDNGIREGDIAKLDYNNICFKGSDFAFSKLQEALPVVKSQDLSSCRWAVEETPNGYKVLFNGREVFFAQKELPSYAYANFKASFRDLNIFVKAYELEKFKEIPTGVDAATVGKLNLVAVAFPERIDFYQRVGNGLTFLSSLPMPTGGAIVGIRLLTKGQKIYVIANAMTSDAEPVSFVATFVGTNPVVVQQNLPYLFGVLRKGDNPLVVAQKYNDGFGKSYSVSLFEGGIKVEKELKVPEDFRADTALLTSDGDLVFIDVGGTLKIYKGDFKKGFTHFMDIEGNFGRSYTAINIPSAVGDTSFRKLFFPPPPVEIQLFGFKGFLVAQNERENIAPLLGEKILKFKQGRLIFVGKNQKGIYETKLLRGFVFQDALQGVAVDGKGIPYAVSGFKNPFLFQKGGSIYRLGFRYF